MTEKGFAYWVLFDTLVATTTVTVLQFTDIVSLDSFVPVTAAALGTATIFQLGKQQLRN